MQRIGLILLLVLLLLPLQLRGEETSTSISLQVITGQTTVRQKEHLTLFLAGEKWNTGESFSLSTPASSEVMIHYLDGSARFRVAADTQAEFSWNAIRLKQGDCWFRFIKRKDRFEIRTPTALLGIRGTTFHVRITADRERIDLLEGKLDIQHGEAHTILQPGEAWQLSHEQSSPHGVVCAAETTESPWVESPGDDPENESSPAGYQLPQYEIPDDELEVPQPGFLDMNEVIGPRSY